MQGDCCTACQNLPNCNVWVWCPTFEGCKYGDQQVFPMYGCDLKHQDNLTDPTQLPQSYSRGPPTPFTSGMASRRKQSYVCTIKHLQHVKAGHASKRSGMPVCTHSLQSMLILVLHNYLVYLHYSLNACHSQNCSAQPKSKTVTCFA